jgi:hypothetical protein
LLVESGCLSKIFAGLFLFSLGHIFFGLLLKGINFDFELFLFVVELSDLLFDVGPNFFPLYFLLKVSIFFFLDGFFLRLFGITSEQFIEEAHLRD